MVEVPTHQSKRPCIVAIDFGAVCPEDNDLEDKYGQPQYDLSDVKTQLDVGDFIRVDIQLVG